MPSGDPRDIGTSASAAPADGAAEPVVRPAWACSNG